MSSARGVAFWLIIGLLAGVWLVAAGCTAGNPGIIGQSVVDQAAIEATALIQNAQATVLIMQAQAEATALVSKAEPAAASQLAISTIADPPTPPAMESNATPIGEEKPADSTPESEQTPEPETKLEIISVSYGADGAYLVVNFLADPQIAQTFWPGALSITDESSGTVYNEVPVMPIIGPLIARPREYGQPGYFMLVNAPVFLQPGSLVTVKLGDYVFEHINVQ
jgi:hypothetical protein